MKKVQVGKAATKEQIAGILAGDMSKSKKMVALFEMGVEVKEIAQLMGVRYNFAYNVVSNHCVVNGIATETEKKVGKKDQIIALYLQGYTTKAIAIELKANMNYVFNTIKAHKASGGAEPQKPAAEEKAE